jgi:hypothetical protein
MAIGSMSKMVGPFLGAWLYAWSISDAVEAIPLIDYRFVFGILIVCAVCSAMVPVMVRSGGVVVSDRSSTELTRISYEAVHIDDDDDDDDDNDDNDDGDNDDGDNDDGDKDDNDNFCL